MAPERVPDGAARGRTPRGHAFRIVCQLADAGELVSELGEGLGDTLRVHGVEPVVTDTERLLPRARELAFGDAQARPVHLAELAGRSLGRALQMHEGEPSDLPVAFAASRNLESVSFEQGEQQVTATVTVHWALTD